MMTTEHRWQMTVNFWLGMREGYREKAEDMWAVRIRERGNSGDMGYRGEWSASHKSLQIPIIQHSSVQWARPHKWPQACCPALSNSLWTFSGWGCQGWGWGNAEVSGAAWDRLAGGQKERQWELQVQPKDNYEGGGNEVYPEILVGFPLLLI